MVTTFDRYVLGRMLHVFLVFFVATYGLFIVIDLFTNVDAFQQGADSFGDLARGVAEYYGYRIFEFLELAGPVLVVIAVVTVIALLEKHHETHPLLAAGIPAFRLLRPMLLGAALMNLCLVLNQEFVLPAIAAPLQTPRGAAAQEVQQVEPVYDYSNDLMHIDGSHVVVGEQSLVDASFTLFSSRLTQEIFTLKAERAEYRRPTRDQPGGWLLKNLTGVLDPDLLTEEGRERVHSLPNGRDAFVVSHVTFDQLYNRGRNLKLLSSQQLVERIRNPATGPVPVRRQTLALHTRMTRPLLSLLSVAISLPLVLRRESRSLIANMSICALVLGVLYGVAQGCYAAGGVALLRPDLAAWIPVITSGSVAMWTSGMIQT